MLSAIVGGNVGGGQQLPTADAASFLLAQGLCIRLRSRRVTRVPVPNRPSQPPAVPPPHGHGERGGQASASEAASHLLAQDLQCKRVTRTSVQSQPLDPAPAPHTRTHNLKSSGRTVRKLNYRKVANLRLVTSPNIESKRRNAKPRKTELPGDGEGKPEARVSRKKQASGKLTREVGLEQRKRAGSVGKSHSVGRQSKPHSVVNPGSHQVDGEVGPEAWSSAVSDVSLKAEFPQVHVQPCVHPAGVSGEDDANCSATPSISERAGDRSVMGDREVGVPVDVHGETQSDSPLCSTEPWFTASANAMCTENGTSSDGSEETACPRIPQREAPAVPVGVEKTRRVSGESKSPGEALKGIVVSLPAAAAEEHLGVDSVHKVPLRGIVTSDVPDSMPSAAIATNHLLTGNDATDTVLACSAATVRTLARNGLPLSKAAVEGEVTDGTPAECGSPSGVLGGETAGPRGTCANVGKDQPADRAENAAPSGLTTEEEVAEMVPLGVATANGAAGSALIEAPSDQTGPLGDVVTSPMPVEGGRASETPARNQVVPGALAGVETTAECTTFELATQDKLTTTVPTHLATEGVIEPVPLGVVAARCFLPESAASKVSPDVTVESGIPSDSPIGKALTGVQLGESRLADATAATSAVTEVSAGAELTMGVFYDVAIDGELMENELADIPTDVTGVAMEMYAVGDPAAEGSVAVGEARGGSLLSGSVREAAEPACEGEDVLYAVLADGELVDIPTDVISDLTEEEADYKAEPLEAATASGENGLFALCPDLITNKMWGSAKAVNSQGMTSSWVFSGNELLQLSLGSSAPLEDEEVGVAPAEGVVSSSLTEEKPLRGTEGSVTAGLTDTVENELRAARNPLGKGVQGVAETQMSEFCSYRTFQNEESKAFTSKGRDVCTCSESDASHCEYKHPRAVEPSECETESVPSPVTNPVPVKCLEQEVRGVTDTRDRRIVGDEPALGDSETALANEAVAICSAKREGFRCRNKRRGSVRLKLRKLNSAVHFLNCSPSLPQPEEFCPNRNSAGVEFCKRRNNCISSDLDHGVQHVEEIKPKNLSLLPLHDFAHRKLCRKPPLLEHLSAIASGLRVLSNCTEIQQESAAPSKLLSVGVYRRPQTKRIEDPQLCFSSQQATSWDVLCHLLTPRKDQPIDASVCRKVQTWLSSRNCKQPLHFGSPVPSNLDLILLLSFISDGARLDQHCVPGRTDLSIIPQHWSQDSRALSQCQAACGHALRLPASLVRAGRCRCPCSRFGLHTVLALSSPACYRLWTRQRHFGRLWSAQRPLLTLFEEGAKRLTPPVPLGKPVCPPSCGLPGLVPWCSQHVPSPCTSTSNVSPLSGWKHGRLANSPSYLPPCLLSGNGASLSEAKSLLLQATSRSHLQHLSFACIVEPSLALPDPPTSSAECTVADAFPTTSSPVPSITYAETQLRTEQKEDHVSPSKPVSKSKESLRKVSQIRIRKTIPKQDTNLTPMGLPKPKRLKKKEFSLEEIYTNQNYKSPSAHSKYLETIFEEPVLKKGSFVCTSLQKRKRLLEFQDYTLPRKRRAHAGVKVPSRTRGRKASTREEEIDSLLVQKLTELEAFLAGEDEGH